MPQWQFVVVDETGTALGELTDAKERKVTWRLLAPGEAEFHINGFSDQATFVEELINDVVVYRDHVPVFRGRIVVSGDSLDADSHDVEVHVTDYRGLLARRTIWPASTLTYTAVDQAAIAWDLISDTQGTTGGNLGITQGIGTTTGVTRTRTFEAGKTIEETISQLAAVVNGFDWEIDALRKLNIFFPWRGSSGVDFAISYDRSGGNVSQVTRSVDPSTYANAVRVSGATGVTPSSQAAGDLATRPEGRWELQYGATDLTTSTAVTETALRLLGEASLFRPAYTVTLAADSGWTPSVFWLGDVCPIRIRRGRLDVNTTAKLVEVEVTIGGDGDETVALTFDRPPVKDRLLRDIRRLAGRVEGLERR